MSYLNIGSAIGLTQFAFPLLLPDMSAATICQIVTVVILRTCAKNYLKDDYSPYSGLAS